MNRLLQVVPGALALVAITTSGAQAADCDRACLQGMITRYVDAMVARDPARLPLAGSARFTEDSQELKPGEGLWKTVTKKGDFRQDYIEVRRQIAASHVMLFEENATVSYSVLLRVTDQKITGIETLVDRILPNSRFKADSLEKPLGGMSAPVPAGKRMPRAEMIAAALRYPEGLRIGNFTDAKTPFSGHVYAEDHAASGREAERRGGG